MINLQVGCTKKHRNTSSNTRKTKKVCPSVLHEKPTSPSSTRQALRGNSGISRARAESDITEWANERFLPPPPLFLSTTRYYEQPADLEGWPRQKVRVVVPKLHYELMSIAQEIFLWPLQKGVAKEIYGQHHEKKEGISKAEGKEQGENIVLERRRSRPLEKKNRKT